MAEINEKDAEQILRDYLKTVDNTERIKGYMFTFLVAAGAFDLIIYAFNRCKLDMEGEK